MPLSVSLSKWLLNKMNICDPLICRDLLIRGNNPVLNQNNGTNKINSITFTKTFKIFQVFTCLFTKDVARYR